LSELITFFVRRFGGDRANLSNAATVPAYRHQMCHTGGSNQIMHVNVSLRDVGFTRIQRGHQLQCRIRDIRRQKMAGVIPDTLGTTQTSVPLLHMIPDADDLAASTAGITDVPSAQIMFFGTAKKVAEKSPCGLPELVTAHTHCHPRYVKIALFFPIRAAV
jgi:hypothetical protein